MKSDMLGDSRPSHLATPRSHLQHPGPLHALPCETELNTCQYTLSLPSRHPGPISKSPDRRRKICQHVGNCRKRPETHAVSSQGASIWGLLSYLHGRNRGTQFRFAGRSIGALVSCGRRRNASGNEAKPGRFSHSVCDKLTTTVAIF